MRWFALVLMLFSTPVMADYVGPDGKVRDCYCTDTSGNRIDLGEMICLQVDGRMFMAQCQMSLNVPMWREVQEGCLSSGLERSQPPINTVTVYPKI
ncbi:hypothetical protein RUESEDTHA_02290 [Ruegeria sp. THAF57]|uniref:hypothetical protein n=1 Tax=Ruegeria sp. THAF57 TaxID=2744555 RepID=UPI0015DE85F1|nr:hypothetical protein [Ruegeria sp. THAF57]CAD0185403.1 hypothetical protein RUESEDTHA_02290 [Ruegeria sp. THAF57]